MYIMFTLVLFVFSVEIKHLSHSQRLTEIIVNVKQNVCALTFEFHDSPVSSFKKVFSLSGIDSSEHPGI